MPFDFSKNETVENLDAVPEDFKSFYQENNEGGYVLRDDPTVKGAVKALTGTNRALSASRREAKDAKEKVVDLSPLSQFGGTPDEILEKVNAAIAEAKSSKGGGDTDALEKLKTDLIADKKREVDAKEVVIQTKDQENLSLRQQLDDITIESSARKAIEENGGNVELLLPFVKRHLKVAELDGQRGVYVMEEDGKTVRPSMSTGGPLPVEDLVKEFKGQEKYAPLFRSEAPSGSGSRPGGPSVRFAGKPRDKMSSLEKISMGIKKGQHLRNTVDHVR